MISLFATLLWITLQQYAETVAQAGSRGLGRTVINKSETVMCQFPSGSYRRGTILNLPFAQVDGKVRRIGFAEARAIGLQILQSADDYSSSISAAFSEASEGALAGEPVSRNMQAGKAQCIAEQVRARYDPGLILDFPIGMTSINGARVSYRTTMAICSTKGYSKIWTRAALLERSDANGMSDDALKETHRLLVKACTIANARVTELYQSDITIALDHVIELETVGQINIFGVDCLGEEIERSIKSFVERAAWSDEEPTTIQDVSIVQALRRVSEICLPGGEEFFLDNGGFSIGKDMDIVPFANSHDVSSLFVTRAFEKEAYVTGLISDNGEHSQTGNFLVGKPNSLVSTAEMAINIGLEY